MTEETERQFLGRVLNYPSEMALSYEITGDDFEYWGRAFDVMKDHYNRSGNLNIVFLAPLFEANGMAKSEPTELHVGYIGGTKFDDLLFAIKNYSGKRKIAMFADELLKVSANRTYEECLAFIDKAKTDISRDSKSVTQLDVLKKMLAPKAAVEIFSTGFHGLDQRMIDGMHRGRVYGFSGRAKAGKTMLALTIAYNLAQKDIQHCYVAMEMGSEEICQRLFARQMKHNSIEYVRGKLPTGVKPQPSMRILDCPGTTWDELQALMLTDLLKYKHTGFIIDYWQLVGGQKSRDTEEKHLRDVAQGFADFAKKHNVWILLLSQTNEDGKTFAGRGLEKACDQLYLIEHPQEEHLTDLRWLKMKVSRYTPQEDYGSPDNPTLKINGRVGPFFEEI